MITYSEMLNKANNILQGQGTTVRDKFNTPRPSKVNLIDFLYEHGINAVDVSKMETTPVNQLPVNEPAQPETKELSDTEEEYIVDSDKFLTKSNDDNNVIIKEKRATKGGEAKFIEGRIGKEYKKGTVQVTDADGFVTTKEVVKVYKGKSRGSRFRQAVPRFTVGLKQSKDQLFPIRFYAGKQGYDALKVDRYIRKNRLPKIESSTVYIQNIRTYNISEVDTYIKENGKK